MAVPSNATDAISYLRSKGSASQTDIFDGVTYWTDDQLYVILSNAVDYKHVVLTPVNKNGTVLVHRMPQHYFINNDTIELDPDVSYTFDGNAFTLASEPTQAIELYVTVWNMNKALADLWEQKASQRFELINVKGGANQLFTEQEYNHCVAQAKIYRSKEIRRFKR